MAHFKCPACMARVWRDGGTAEHARDRVPPAARDRWKRSSGLRRSSA
jgi:hypothetical protein